MTTVVRVVELAGPFAENKDTARSIRVERILPALEGGQRLVIDFGSVTNTTQSFIHACLAEALRKGGDAVLDRIEFKACNSVVRSVVATVAEYSVRAHTLARGNVSPVLEAADVPQADSLATVRAVVAAVCMGNQTIADVAFTTGYSVRHAAYRLHAARILGLVVLVGQNLVGPTDEAFELLDSRPGSAEESLSFERAVRNSPKLRALAPDLLARRPILKGELAERIARRAHLSPATASRRAQCLLAWRRQIRQGRQLQLPTMPTGTARPRSGSRA